MTAARRKLAAPDRMPPEPDLLDDIHAPPQPKSIRTVRGKVVYRGPLQAPQADRMPPQTERDFQAQVMDMARRLGWTLQYHTWSSKHSAAGFPDLVLLHPQQKRVLYVECKALDRYGIPKRLTPAQGEWIETLRACGQDVRVWTPLDWDEIERALKGR